MKYKSKLGIIFLVIVVCILSGCGKRQIMFRNIPFGTKYSNAIAKIEEDLKAQKYDGKPEEFEAKYVVERTYNKVKLYEYSALMTVDFLKIDNDNKNDSLLYKAHYIIPIKNEVVAYKQLETEKNYFNFFFDKLTENYGECSETEEYYAKWVKGNTICELNKSNNSISIYYEAQNIKNQFNKMLEKEEAKEQESINSGL